MKYCKSVTREVSMRASTLEDHKLTVETVQGKNSKDHSAQKVLSDRQTLMHKETVKPMVYQNCRSSFASGHILKHVKFCVNSGSLATYLVVQRSHKYAVVSLTSVH